MEKQNIDFIKNFNPVWFAAVLGFGGIALASVLITQIFDAAWLKPLAMILVYFNFVLLLYVFAIWLLRAILYFDGLIAELKHPVVAGFHSLMPAAVIMISINFSKLGLPLSLWQYQTIAVVFWVIGAVFEIIFLTLTLYYLIINEKMNVNFMNGGWLVPPVAALLTTIGGLNIVLFISSVPVASNLLWINYFFFGAGVFIFFLLAFSIFTKIFFAEKLDPKVFPSLWIMMVPFSLMALCLSLFAETTGLFLPDFKNALTGICLLLNPMLIGIGVWLLILLMLLSLYYFKNIKVPFGPGWWAFIFPTASVSIASLNFAVLTRRLFFGYIGVIIYVLLLGLTVVVIAKTLKSLTTKNEHKAVTV